MIVRVKRVWEVEDYSYYDVSDLEIIQHLKARGHKASEFSSVLSIMQNVSLNEYKDAAIKIALNKNRHGEKTIKQDKMTRTFSGRKGRIVDSVDSVSKSSSIDSVTDPSEDEFNRLFKV